jgi:DNA (cytosine-5)-methyltransferase 1
VIYGIDLFAGAGGMSLGASAAGINVRLAIESDPYAACTYKSGHPNTNVFVGDIRRFTRAHFPRPKGNLVVFGGPPCQGFSTSNQRTRSRENPKNWLFEEFLRVVSMYEPEFVVFENVRGLKETSGGEFLDRVLASLANLKYHLSHSILNAVDFGVPQRRSRYFIVGSRTNVGIDLTRLTSRRSPAPSVKEVFGDLPKLDNGWAMDMMPYVGPPVCKYSRKLRAGLKESSNHFVTRNSARVLERYKHVPPGGNWENIPARLMKNYEDRSRCHTGIYHRLDSDTTASVIGNYRKNMLIHPWEDRGLSVREAARLQSFPDRIRFNGTIGFQQQQVGNAVPPLLAKALFDYISHKAQ